MTDAAPTPPDPPAPKAGHPAAPSPSTVAGAGVGIPLSIVIIWSVQTFGHVTVPPLVATALGAFLAAVAGYFHPGGNNGTVSLS